MNTPGPQLRTLLLTDLVDSTGVVERMGDVPAAALFREHDALVLELQQRWRGRLIDRSDGMLLLFERAIDGLGFALDYTVGLRKLGQAHGVDLQARSGLHVGEVLSWKNSDEAVQLGAKQVEVEGLAKPMAARLMTLARPGQILVSAMAEPLARRSARELGERGQNLLWKSYGRWRFKGIPETHEIHEVGEVGIAPLRAPRNGPKAWRDIPLWRRPAALAVEILLLVGLGVGGWLLTKPQPAIAFAERDWVVVADLRNLTGQGVLDDSLEQAFRISLEQSRHVNVLSDMKARDTLARMQRAPGTPLDREVASEIAIRDGARAVILATVSEVGGRLRISAEVIDPHSQATVYAHAAEGSGAASVLGSIDQLTAALRQDLGEALASIQEDSVPLPLVTTANLDALRAFALGQAAYAKGAYGEAGSFYQRAVMLDPEFALAHLGSVRASVAAVDADAAMPHLAKAIALRDRLPPREALYLDAWAAEFTPGDTALEKWKQLSLLYPEYFAGAANHAGALLRAGDYATMEAVATALVVPQNPLRSIGFDYLGRAALGQEKHAQAERHLQHAVELGLSSSLRRLADVHAVDSRFDQAHAYLDQMHPGSTFAHIERISLAVDQGEWQRAMAAADEAYGLDGNTALMEKTFATTRGVMAMLAGEQDRAAGLLQEAAGSSLQALQAPSIANRVDHACLALAAAHASQRNGETGLAQAVLAGLEQHPDVQADGKVEELAQLVRAGLERSSGQPEAAIARLRPYLTGGELFQLRAGLLEAYFAAGQFEAALGEARWLAAHRGRAYIELNGNQVNQALNVADTRLAHLRAGESLARLGRRQEAQREVEAFLQAWPSDSLPAYLRLRVEAILPASKQ